MAAASIAEGMSMSRSVSDNFAFFALSCASFLFSSQDRFLRAMRPGSGDSTYLSKYSGSSSSRWCSILY